MASDARLAHANANANAAPAHRGSTQGQESKRGSPDGDGPVNGDGRQACKAVRKAASEAARCGGRGSRRIASRAAHGRLWTARHLTDLDVVNVADRRWTPVRARPRPN